MSYQKPNDPMANIVIAIASIVLLAAVVVLLDNLYSTIQRNSSVVTMVKAESGNTESASQTETKDAVNTDTDAKTEPKGAANKEEKVSKLASAIHDNIRPIGSADASASSGSSAARSGEEIFNTVCTACHTAGVLEAPKFGDKAAWEPRMANGFDALLTSAINGKGNMPAKGGDASLSDDEVKATIIFMLEKAGIDAGVSTTPAAAPEAATTEAAPSTDAANTTATETTTPATAPAASNVETTSAAATTPAATVDATAETTETPATAPIEAPSAPEAAPAPVTPEVPTTPTTPTIPEAPAQPASTTETPAADNSATSAPASDVTPTTEAASTPAPVADNSAEGKKLYKTLCFTCHGTGVAGAPILGNKEQWAPRIAQGKDTLYHTALNGKGAMPAKGGNPSLDDNLVKAAVDYMISNSQ